MDEQQKQTTEPAATGVVITTQWMSFIGVIITILGLLTAGLFAFSSRPTGEVVRQKIRDYAAPRESVVRMEECLKSIRDQLNDMKKDFNHRLDKIEERLPIKTANGKAPPKRNGD